MPLWLFCFPSKLILEEINTNWKTGTWHFRFGMAFIIWQLPGTAAEAMRVGWGSVEESWLAGLVIDMITHGPQPEPKPLSNSYKVAESPTGGDTDEHPWCLVHRKASATWNSWSVYFQSSSVEVVMQHIRVLSMAVLTSTWEWAS